MTAREKMKKWREERQLDYDDISKMIDVGSHLIEMIEQGHVTHPIIARKMQKLYSLTDLEMEELLPENKREHSHEYEPDRYINTIAGAFNKYSKSYDDPRSEYYAYMKGKKDHFQRQQIRKG